MLTAVNPETQVDVSVELIPPSNAATQFTKFVPDNTIVCRSDIIPGIKDDHLPLHYSDKLIEEISFTNLGTIWAHNIKFENLSKIDTLFNKFLTTHVAKSGYAAEIISRKLTSTSSNSVFMSALSSTSVELKARESKKEGNYKVENPKQILKIHNLPSSKLTCLVFRIVYRVRF